MIARKVRFEYPRFKTENPFFGSIFLYKKHLTAIVKLYIYILLVEDIHCELYKLFKI